LYKRPDVPGPKLSTYDKVALNSDIAKSLEDILSRSVGVLGVVKKTRLLYITGQTRIHIDKVDGLGNFIELEVCKSILFYITISIKIQFTIAILIQVVLEKDQNIETAQKIADDLMQALFIKKDDLIAKAYIDLLNSKA